MTKTSDGLQIDETLGAIVLDKAGVIIPDREELSYSVAFDGPTPKAFVLYTLGKDNNGEPMWYNSAECDSTSTQPNITIGLTYEFGDGTLGDRVILIGWYKETTSQDDPWKQAKIEVDDFSKEVLGPDYDGGPYMDYRFAFDNGSGTASYPSSNFSIP
jgi:hypothetical protein